MKSGLRIILFCLIIFLLMHYKKYCYYNENYTIDQQELDYVNGNELYNQSNPLIITFINRLSDYLFVLARYISFLNNVKEIKWNASL